MKVVTERGERPFVPDECGEGASIRPIVGRLGSFLDLLPHIVGVLKTILAFVTAQRMTREEQARRRCEEGTRSAPRDTSGLWRQLGNPNVPAQDVVVGC